MSSILVWREVAVLARRAQKRFGLRTYTIGPETHPRARRYGACSEAGAITLRVHVLGRPSRPLKRSTILRTLAHELAHLREWDHGRAHRALTQEILVFWGL